MENTSTYIESGVLEQYVLGELPPAERAAVEAAAAREPVIRQALAELQAGLEVYAQALAQPAPAGLRVRVLSWAVSQIQAQNAAQNAAALAAQSSASTTASVAQPSPLRVSPPEERAADSPVAGPTPLVAANPTSPARPLYPAATATATGPRAGTSRWALAASVALVLSLAGNAVLYSRWQQSHAALLAVQQEQAGFAANSQVVNQQLAKTRQEVRVLRDERFRVVALAGTKAAPTARARVLYNPATQAVFVDVRQLPALPAGKQYQLWALDKGQPVDAGIVATATATGQGMQQMKDVARAQAFAMTVEPAGGSAQPTLSTMTVMGAVTGVGS